MARFRYQHIKSSVEGKAPTAAQIKVAEIGVNDFAGDEKLFIKNSEGTVVDFPRGYSRSEIQSALDDKLDVSAYTPTDLSNYYTKSETSGVSEIADALDDKLDVSAYTPTDLSNYYTKSQTSGATEIQDALDDKQDTLVSGTNIKTINNESILGEGNITISGGSGVVDQVLDETTSASTNAIATQAVYAAVFDLSGQSETVAAALVDLNSQSETVAAALVDLNSQSETVATALVDLDERVVELSGRTPIVAVDEVIDSTTSGSSNPVATKAVYNAIIENEEIISAALSDLDDRKLDSSAYTPVDLSNYYTKSQTSGASEIADALDDKLDSSAYTPVDLSNYYTKSETSGASEIADALDDKLDSSAYTPTDLSNYYTKSETSGATEISTALVGKSDTGHTHDDRYYTETEVDTALAAKANTATTLSGYGITDAYTKTEVDSIELVISQAFNDLDQRKLNSSAFTAHTADTTVHHISTSAVTNGSTDVIESGGVYAQLDGVKLKKITQSAYDVLVQSSATDPNTLYIITD